MKAHEFRLYAHRGASAQLPENTMVAFELARDIGVDALELDIHRSSDGELVVCHDSSALRCCGLERNIAESSYQEIRSWNAAWHFHQDGKDAPDFLQMPRFAEVIEHFPQLRLNVDIKFRHRDASRIVVNYIKRMAAESRITLASFHTHKLAEVRALGYKGEIALSRPEALALIFAPAPMVRFLRAGRPAQLPLGYGPLRFDTQAFVTKCHKLGLRVDYWVINDPEKAKVLVHSGADGIMSDDPAAIRAALMGAGR